MTGEQPRARVLVVEDNPVNRLTLVRGVEREGHDVLAASNGREALDVLASEDVELVLLDLLMPVLDGFAVLEALRSDADLRDVPVIVISAVDEVESVARAIEMGAVDVLPKPFDPLLLRVRLRTALAQRRLRRLEKAYLNQELALREHERLAAVGRLSAGLAHELNNPAAAALRLTRQVQEHLAVAHGLLPVLPAEAVAALPEAHDVGAADRLDLEDALRDVLDARGVEEPWLLAADLARSGVRADDLDAMLAAAGGATGAAARWATGQLAVGGALEQLLHSVERVSAIVGALRSYAFLDRGEEQDVDVRQCLEDTLEVLSHKLPRTVSVRRDYAEELPSVPARGGQLNQVWTNLLDNALDALDGGGTLTLRASAEDGAVVVRVEDDGPGIPTDLVGAVFDPFVTTKPPGKGAGLGLNVAHRIVTEGHSGQLSVESRPGRTVFTVRLPATAVAARADG